ncbi:hypothetical protein VTN96DRAFT_3518 [Rasamsonia emersonii]|uniref:3-hydroxyacyl-CoA dehydrogenase, NAD binding domain protein n=1 Tax=Rasamsonia emersonii (strain ATCC 16479 / CBS 393.64 / IMI 116815) TaxID=1408163 RepID=A0A0F4YS86_RASE3|nr:3-hydroxyacyl-CoA dehydrogenase, NAD binding domain protein [Rasamsonia emersonii CBS 393.64]KKA20965.1 3-hydroxyacyl-CoA dehydrogenase, NAD binding domain protein [Rasamsonia emersonii CBS 393.64]
MARSFVASQPSSTKPNILALDNGLSQPLPENITQDIFSAGRILQLDQDRMSVQPIVEKAGLIGVDGIDYCKANGRIYWTNMGFPNRNDGSVMSCDTDGRDLRTILPVGSVHTPKQLVIDQLANKIYIADREGLRIFRCDLDGSNLTVLVKAGDWHIEKDDQTKWCVGVAVSQQHGRFYWTQKGPSKGGRGRIFSAKIMTPPGDVGNRADIQCLLDNLPEPVHLEIDEDSGILFWTDRGEFPFGNTLNKVDLDASGNATLLKPGPIKHKIIAQNFDEAIGVKVDPMAKHIYVSDLGGSIWRCSFDGGEKQKIYEDKTCCFTGLALLYVM